MAVMSKLPVHKRVDSAPRIDRHTHSNGRLVKAYQLPSSGINGNVNNNSKDPDRRRQLHENRHSSAKYTGSQTTAGQLDNGSRCTSQSRKKPPMSFRSVGIPKLEDVVPLPLSSAYDPWSRKEALPGKYKGRRYSKTPENIPAARKTSKSPYVDKRDVPQTKTKNAPSKIPGGKQNTIKQRKQQVASTLVNSSDQLNKPSRIPVRKIKRASGQIEVQILEPKKGVKPTQKDNQQLPCRDARSRIPRFSPKDVDHHKKNVCPKSKPVQQIKCTNSRNTGNTPPPGKSSNQYTTTKVKSLTYANIGELSSKEKVLRWLDAKEGYGNILLSPRSPTDSELSDGHLFVYDDTPRPKRPHFVPPLDLSLLEDGSEQEKDKNAKPSTYKAEDRKPKKKSKDPLNKPDVIKFEKNLMQKLISQVNIQDSESNFTVYPGIDTDIPSEEMWQKLKTSIQQYVDADAKKNEETSASKVQKQEQNTVQCNQSRAPRVHFALNNDHMKHIAEATDMETPDSWDKLVKDFTNYKKKQEGYYADVPSGLVSNTRKGPVKTDATWETIKCRHLRQYGTSSVSNVLEKRSQGNSNNKKVQKKCMSAVQARPPWR